MPSFNQLLARLSDMFSFGSQIGIPLANRNMFIDGAFDFFTTAGTVSLPAGGAISAATMWYGQAGLGGSATHQISGQRATAAQVAVTESAPYNSLCHVQTVASTGTFASNNLPWIGQKVESVQRTAGRSVTLSCKIYASAPLTIPGMYYSQNFGSGGSPSGANTQGKAVTWNVGTIARKFSVRVDVAALPAGVVYGTNNNDYCQFGVFLPSGWTGTLFTTEWQLEYCNANASNDLNGNGGAPTAFEYRGNQAELARVQRFYQVLNTHTAVFNAPGSGYQLNAYKAFHTTMRVMPAITWTAAGVGNANTQTTTDQSTDGATCQMLSTASGNCFFQTGQVIADCRL